MMKVDILKRAVQSIILFVYQESKMAISKFLELKGGFKIARVQAKQQEQKNESEK